MTREKVQKEADLDLEDIALIRRARSTIDRELFFKAFLHDHQKEIDSDPSGNVRRTLRKDA